MNGRCPGKSGRRISAKDVLCSLCGYAVEIFCDEPKIRCPKCRSLVFNNSLPSCVDWCKAARDCAGEASLGLKLIKTKGG